MTSKEEIKNYTNLLCNSIRKYALEQVKDWNKIPYLTLQVDGKGGYSNDYNSAYIDGIWKLNESIYLDCATGELVTIEHDKNNKIILKEAPNYLLVDLANSLERFNVKNIIKDLHGKLNWKDSEPYSLGYWNEKQKFNGFILLWNKEEG